MTGKTVLLKDIVKHKRHLQKATVITANNTPKEEYESFIPEVEYFTECSDKAFQNDSKMVILDEFPLILYEKYDTYKFYTTSNTLNIATIQYGYSFAKEVVKATDYVFIFKEDSLSNRIKLYKQFCGTAVTFESFNHLFDEYTNDYTCLVLDVRKPLTNANEQIKWYKATL